MALWHLQLVSVPVVARLHVEHDGVSARLGFALRPDRGTGGLVLLQHTINLDVLELEGVYLRLDFPLRHDDELLARLCAAEVDELVSVLRKRIRHAHSHEPGGP